jgi:hypothetical protein
MIFQKIFLLDRIHIRHGLELLEMGPSRLHPRPLIHNSRFGKTKSKPRYASGPVFVLW